MSRKIRKRRGFGSFESEGKEWKSGNDSMSRCDLKQGAIFELPGFVFRIDGLSETQVYYQKKWMGGARLARTGIDDFVKQYNAGLKPPKKKSERA